MTWKTKIDDTVPRRLRVTRTLVFEGPEDWIRATLEKSWLQPDQDDAGLPGPQKYAREISRVEEVLEP